MLQLLLDVKDNFDQYFGMGWFLPLFLIGLLLLLLTAKEERRRFWVAGSILILLASFFLPCILIIEKCIGMEVYWRVYWLLPINAVIAFLLTECFPKKEKPVWYKAVYFLLLAVVLVSGGSLVFNRESFSKSENAYELSDEAIGLADVILAQAGEEEELRAIFPPQYVVDVRQYSAKIQMMYGRKNLSKAGKTARKCYEMGLCAQSYEGLYKLAKKHDYSYIIYLRDASSDTYLQDRGFSCIGVVGDYGVYKRGTK